MLSRIGFSKSKSRKNTNESNFEDDSIDNDMILHELLMDNNHGDEYSQSFSSVSTNTPSNPKQTLSTTPKRSEQIQKPTNTTKKNKQKSNEKYYYGNSGIQNIPSNSYPLSTQNRITMSKQESYSSKFSSFSNQQRSPKQKTRTSSMSSSSASTSTRSAFRDGHFELLTTVPRHSETSYSNDKKSLQSYSRKSTFESNARGEASNFSNYDNFSQHNQQQYQQQPNYQPPFNQNQSQLNSDGNNSLRNITINESNRQRHRKSQTETDELYDDDDDTNDFEVLLRMFGEPYSNQISFWIRIIPSVITLGVLIGLGSLLFLFSYKTFFFYWVYHDNDDDDFDDDYDDSLTTLNNTENTIILLTKGSWWWLWMTTLGQFFAACFLLFPNAPSLGEAKTFFHDAVTLQGNPKETPYVIISSFLSLCSGASIGPEMVLGAYGTGLANYLGQMFNNNSQDNHEENSSSSRIKSFKNQFCKYVSYPLQIFHSQQRIQMCLVLCGMSAALGSVLPSPILAVLIVLELSVTARPSDLRLDAAVRRSNRRNFNFNERQNNHGRGRNWNQNNEINDPHRSFITNGKKDHDYMEQITLIGIAATSAFVTFHGLFSIFMQKEDNHSPVKNEFFGENTNYVHTLFLANESQNQGEEKPNMWHVLMAVPLGMFCGALGGLFLLFNGIFRKIRDRICAGLRRFGFPTCVAHLLIPTLCGLLHGIITVYFPLTLGSGTLILSDLIHYGFNVYQDGYAGISPQHFFLSGIMKIFTSALCLGFGGLVGGQMFPLVFAGACMGIAIPHYIPFFPVQLTVPCCMASITGSIVPVPLTISAFAMLRLGNNVEMGAAVLVSVVTAYTCNGGLGVVQRGKKTLGLGEEDVLNRREPLLDLNEYQRMDEMVMDNNSKEMVRDYLLSRIPRNTLPSHIFSDCLPRVKNIMSASNDSQSYSKKLNKGLLMKEWTNNLNDTSTDMEADSSGRN